MEVAVASYAGRDAVGDFAGDGCVVEARAVSVDDHALTSGGGALRVDVPATFLLGEVGVAYVTTVSLRGDQLGEIVLLPPIKTALKHQLVAAGRKDWLIRELRESTPGPGGAVTSSFSSSSPPPVHVPSPGCPVGGGTVGRMWSPSDPSVPCQQYTLGIAEGLTTFMSDGLDMFSSGSGEGGGGSAATGAETDRVGGRPRVALFSLTYGVPMCAAAVLQKHNLLVDHQLIRAYDCVTLSSETGSVWYGVRKKIRVRAGVELDSELLGELEPDDVLLAQGQTKTLPSGDVRVKLCAPKRGWTTRSHPKLGELLLPLSVPPATGEARVSKAGDMRYGHHAFLLVNGSSTSLVNAAMHAGSPSPGAGRLSM
jgi:hypothetical protein